MNDAAENLGANSDTAVGEGVLANPGGDKVEPMSASPSSGKTIAGRTVNTGGTLDVTNRGDKLPQDVGGPHTGGPDTEGKGVTGQQGDSESASHDGPQTAAQSR